MIAQVAQIWARTFSALEARDFRWFWMGRLASLASFQMVTVARRWLVYDMTGSALALGWVSTARSVALFAFSLLGGIMADRMSKRNLLLAGRAMVGANLLVLAILISGGAIRLWHLVASSLVSGMTFSLVLPAREALIPELVDRRALLNAQALNSMGLGLMGVLASVLGGILIGGIGVGPVYYVSALLYLITIAAYLRLPTGRGQRGGLSYRGIGRDIGEGLDYIRRNAHPRVLLSARLARALLALPYRTFLPVFAADILGVGAAGLGVLSAAPRFGAMAASLVVAYLGDLKRKGQCFLAAGMAMG